MTKDVVKALYKITLKPPKIKDNYYRILNICKGKQNSLFEFIKEIEKVTKLKAKIKLMPLQKGDIPSTLGSKTNLKNTIKTIPSTPISVGIKNFIDWYLKYTKKN